MDRKTQICCLLCGLAPGFCLAEGEQATDQGQQEERSRIQTVADVFEQPGVLTPKGTVVFDTSLNYSQNSSNKVSIVGYTILPTLLIGYVEVSDSDRTTITAGVTARYGITNRLEGEVRVPWVYRNDQIVTGKISDGTTTDDTEVITLDGSHVGDIEGALRYQINMDSYPFWVGGLKIKSTTGRSPYDLDYDSDTNTYTDVPTGSGFWSMEPSLSMIYPTDPAVIFMNLAYIYNFEDKVGSGDTKYEIDLGDTIALGAGMGFSVNPNFSFSLGISHKTIMKSKVDGSYSNDAQLLQLDSISFGSNLALNERWSLNVSAAAGLTEDSPDFQLTIRVPYSF